MDTAQHQLNSEELHLNKIKDILLKEDREELIRLRNLIQNEEEFSKIVNPYIEKHVLFLKNNFPDQYKKEVSILFEEQLKNSRQEIIDIMSPSMGILIKKYISLQFELLKEKMDSQVKNTFSVVSWKNKFKSAFYGVKESEIILTEMDKYEIQEIYLVQRDSGLLFGSASKSVNIDKDVIAGMLTAIKSFVEDAFQQGNQDLDMIEYGHYKILMQNFKTYYLALVISGSLSAFDKDQLSNQVLSFADAHLNQRIDLIDEDLILSYSKLLKAHFLK